MYPSEFPAARILVVSMFCAACSTGIFARGPVATATVSLANASGATVGTAQLRQGRDAVVTVDGTVSSLTPGSHGIHFHAVGLCEGGTAFSTAGAHYNPLNREHGLARPGGPHAGDAPNITAGPDGRATFSFTTDRVTLIPGTSASLFDSDGSALVIHAAADDQVSQPSGNSGGRVACGVVRSATP